MTEFKPEIVEDTGCFGIVADCGAMNNVDIKLREVAFENKVVFGGFVGVVNISADENFRQTAVWLVSARKEDTVVLIVSVAKFEVDVGESFKEVDFVFKFGFYTDDFHSLAPFLALFAHSSASSLSGSPT